MRFKRSEDMPTDSGEAAGRPCAQLEIAVIASAMHSEKRIKGVRTKMSACVFYGSGSVIDPTHDGNGLRMLSLGTESMTMNAPQPVLSIA